MHKKSFISGVVSTKGKFSNYIITKNRQYFNDWRFTIDLNKRDLKVLELIKEQLGCGSIRKLSTNMLRFEVVSQHNNVKKVIPYFNKALIGHQKKDFEYWKNELIAYYKGRRLRRIKASKRIY